MRRREGREERCIWFLTTNRCGLPLLLVTLFETHVNEEDAPLAIDEIRGRESVDSEDLAHDVSFTLARLQAGVGQLLLGDELDGAIAVSKTI